MLILVKEDFVDREKEKGCFSCSGFSCPKFQVSSMEFIQTLKSKLLISLMDFSMSKFNAPWAKVPKFLIEGPNLTDCASYLLFPFKPSSY